MIPLIRLGGPEQPRFLYVMLIPVMAGLGLVLARIRGPAARTIVPAAGVVLGLVLAPSARAACEEWRDAGAQIVHLISRAAQLLPADMPVIAVNPPEWHGSAHLLRNGLFSALRLTTGHGYHGVTIPPSQAVTTCGQLVAWLAQNAPGYLTDTRAVAWLFVDDGICPLKGWQDPAVADLPLGAMCATR